MKGIAVILMTVIMTAFLTRYAPGSGRLEPFHWLLGTWKMETGRYDIIETWKAMDDSSLLGSSIRVSKAGDSVLTETIRLVSRNQEYYYIPKAFGQNNDQPVEFRITSYSDSGFISENPKHDFPRRIGYTLRGPDRIHAFIDDGKQVPEKKFDFIYSRIK
jgi:hypothetical protein